MSSGDSGQPVNTATAPTGSAGLSESSIAPENGTVPESSTIPENSTATGSSTATESGTYGSSTTPTPTTPTAPLNRSAHASDNVPAAKKKRKMTKMERHREKCHI